MNKKTIIKAAVIIIFLLIVTIGFAFWFSSKKDERIKLTVDSITTEQAKNCLDAYGNSKSNIAKKQNCMVHRGGSMRPLLKDGQYTLFDTSINNYQRKDIVIFAFPDNENIYFFKRIIGLPGEKISISGGVVYINGSVLNENEYLGKEIQTDGKLEISLGEYQYFVMGDNRKMSRDSRHWGPLEKDNILGKFIKIVKVVEVKK